MNTETNQNINIGVDTGKFRVLRTYLVRRAGMTVKSPAWAGMLIKMHKTNA